MDLTLHMHYSPQRDGDVIAYTRNLLQQFSAAPLSPEHAMAAVGRLASHSISLPLLKVAWQALLHVRVLVRDVFIRDQMQLRVSIHGGIDPFQKTDNS